MKPDANFSPIQRRLSSVSRNKPRDFSCASRVRITARLFGDAGWFRFGRMKTYGQVIDSIEALPEEQQESLIELLQRRLAERRRTALVKSVQEARKEFKSGKCRRASPAEIMRKVLA
jgi:hypothetical protein